MTSLINIYQTPLYVPSYILEMSLKKQLETELSNKATFDNMTIMKNSDADCIYKVIDNPYGDDTYEMLSDNQKLVALYRAAKELSHY